MSVTCCLLLAAAALTAWYGKEYIVLAYLQLPIGLSNLIIHQCTSRIPLLLLYYQHQSLP